MKASNLPLSLFNKNLQYWSKKSLLNSALKRFLYQMMESFIGNNDLRIWQTYDRFGKNWWHAYDPLTGKRTSVASEAELRVWIEQRYYN
ncbi:MAG TPA: hypothetical protein V6D14_07020 [Coleofasciculaceae cyanobacterium]|jgi:hypothetical protein